MPCPSAMVSPKWPHCLWATPGAAPWGTEEGAGKPENLLEHLTLQISLHPGKVTLNLICVSPSLPGKADGGKPALCKPRRVETAFWGPTASPTHLPSTLFYLIMSTGWECHESFKLYSQDLSKLLVLEIRPGFGGQRQSFGPFGLVGATQAAPGPHGKHGSSQGHKRMEAENPHILLHLRGLSGEAEIKRTLRSRTVMLLLVKTLHAAKVQFVAPLTGWGLRRSQRAKSTFPVAHKLHSLHGSSLLNSGFSSEITMVCINGNKNKKPNPKPPQKFSTCRIGNPSFLFRFN